MSRTRGGVVSRSTRTLEVEYLSDREANEYSVTSGEFSYPQIDICHDNPTKNFYKRVKQGEIINTPYEKFTTRILAPSVSLKWVKEGTDYGEHSIIRGSLVPGAWSGEPDRYNALSSVWHLFGNEMHRLGDFAFTDAMSKVGAPQLDALVSLVELPETIHYGVHLMRNLHKKLHQVLRPDIGHALQRGYHNTMGGYHRRLTALRRKERAILRAMSNKEYGRHSMTPQLASVRREISSLCAARQLLRKTYNAGKSLTHRSYVNGVRDRWLEYRYSIMTTVYEFQDWTQAVLFSDPPKTPRLTTRANRHGSVTVDEGPPGGFSWPCRGNPRMDPVPWSIRMTGNIQFGARAGCIYTPRMETWRTKYGVEWHRLPLAAWEVTKLSFVADWFLNTSKYYEARTAVYRCSHIDAGWVKYYARGEVRIDVTPESDLGWLAASSRTTTAILRFDYRSREVRTADMVAWGADIHLGIKQMADLTALSHGLFTRISALFK